MRTLCSVLYFVFFIVDLTYRNKSKQFYLQLMTLTKLSLRQICRAAVIVAMFLCPSHTGVWAQDSGTLPDNGAVYSGLTHYLGLRASGDYVFSSIRDDLFSDYDWSSKPSTHIMLAPQIRYAFSFNNPEVHRYCPGVYQGIGVNLMSFNGLKNRNSDHSAPADYIGTPLGVFVLQGAPFWHITHNISLDYEWNFGATFGWRKYCDANWDFNLITGSRVNAYLNAACMLRWQISDFFAFTAGVELSHFSNGNTSWPNPGINAMGLRIGMDYCLGGTSAPVPCLPDTAVRRRITYDVTLWGAVRKRVYRGGEEPVLLKGHYSCAGISFAPMRELGRWYRVGGAVDLQWDESSSLRRYVSPDSPPEDPKFYRPDFFRQISAGISAHAELDMPVFAVNVGIGVNILAPEENRGTYQSLTLKTYLTPFLFLNVGYQLRDFHSQSNLMLGLGVTI